MYKMQSFRSSVNEQLTSAGEETLRVLEKRHQYLYDDVSKLKHVKVFVAQRLQAASRILCDRFQREMDDLYTLLEHYNTLLLELRMTTADEETALQKDVEDSQPSDRVTPGSNLMPTTMVSDVPETSASHDCNSMRTQQQSSALSMDSSILAKDSNAESGGSKDSQSTSSSKKVEFYTGELTSVEKQLPVECPAEDMKPQLSALTSGKQRLLAESPAEVMTPHPPPALIIDLSLLEKDSKAEPGGSKDSQSSSTQGELHSEGLTSTEMKLPVESPAEVMTLQVFPAFMIDFSVLEKDSNADPRGSKNSQSSATKGELLCSSGLVSLDLKFPAKSPNEVRNQQPSSVLGIGILCKDSTAEPGDSKDSPSSSPSTQGEFSSERSAEQQPPAESPAEPPVDVPSAPFTHGASNDKENHHPWKASQGELSSEGQEVTTPQLSSALTMDLGILFKHSNAEPGGSKDSQSSSTQGGLYSEGLTSVKQQLPAESPAEVMTPHLPPDTAGSSGQPPVAKRGRTRKTAPAPRDCKLLNPQLMTVRQVNITDFMVRRMKDLAREPLEKTKLGNLARRANEKLLHAPPVKRTRLAVQDKEGLEGGVADRDGTSKMEYFAFEDLSSDKERTQEKVSREAGAATAALSTDEETALQKDVEDSRPSDRVTPGSNLMLTTMVSDIPETSASHDCNSMGTQQQSSALSMDSSILAKDSNAESGSSKDSQSTSSSKKVEFYTGGLTIVEKQLPVESPAEVMTPQLSSALTMDSGVLSVRFKAEPGDSKDSQSSPTRQRSSPNKQRLPAESPAEVMTPHPPPALIIDLSLLEEDSDAEPGGTQSSSTQGELYSEGLTSTEMKLPVESPAEVMTPQVSPALMIDFSIQEKDSNADPRGSKNSQSSATKGEPLCPSGLMSLDQDLLAKSPNELRNQQPSSILSLDSGILGDLEDPSAVPGGSKDSQSSSTHGGLYLEGLTSVKQRLPAESPAEVMTLPDTAGSSRQPPVAKRGRGRPRKEKNEKNLLHAPPVKRTREDKEGLEGGVADGGGSKMENFGFDHLGNSDRDKERTQEKVSREAAAVIAALGTDPILAQEEPEPPPQSKEEQKELVKGPEEAGCSALTLPASKSEDYNEHSWTEPLSSTSSEHMETQDGGASQPTGESQTLRLRCSESDSDDSDEWEETRARTSTGRVKTRAATREAQPALRRSRRGQKSDGIGKENVSQDTKASKEPPSKTSVRGGTSCTVCGKKTAHLENHMLSHAAFVCTVCDEVFGLKDDLNTHMTTHTNCMTTHTNFGCTVCDEVFGLKNDLNTHMTTHTSTAATPATPFNCTAATPATPISCTDCNKSFLHKFHLAGSGT